MSGNNLVIKSKILVDKLTLNGVIYNNVVLEINKIKPIHKEWQMGGLTRRMYGKEQVNINVNTGVIKI